MSVYVDPLFPTPRTAGWRYRCACHLFADSIEELHAFAAKIGLLREWFQESRRGAFPHYDLTSRKRCEAIAAGAKQLTRFEVGKRIMNEAATH